MMSKSEIIEAEKAERSEQKRASPQQPELNEEDRSKDAFFAQVAELGEAIIARHGRDFAIGTFVLAAKFIAEGKALANGGGDGGEAKGAGKPG
jgi:amino acid permease